jgi:hypothetical protein
MRCVWKLKDGTTPLGSTRFTRLVKDATHLGYNTTQMRPNVKIIDCFQEKKYAKRQVGYAVRFSTDRNTWCCRVTLPDSDNTLYETNSRGEGVRQSRLTPLNTLIRIRFLPLSPNCYFINSIALIVYLQRF